jgi:mannose/cellobiose epimerase-like protein (N-acyl-D-glucosamine 2-epimerase family)
MYTIKSTKFPNQRWDILKDGKVISSTYHSYKLACVLFSQAKNFEKIHERVLAIQDSAFLFGIEYDRQIKEAHNAAR